MNLHLSPRTRVRASTLLWTLFIAFGMGLVLVAYLSMISGTTRLTARSQGWNLALTLAEAGAEEAMAHLNKNGVNNDPGKLIFAINLETEGWQMVSNQYYMRRGIGEGYYEVFIKFGARPLITSSGFAPFHGVYAQAPRPWLAAVVNPPWESAYTFVSRTVQVRARANGRFTKAIVAKSKVELKGVEVDVDSYHSHDPAGSTWDGAATNWGIYDVTKRRDSGDVAVMDGFQQELKVEKATVRGRVATGPDGDVKTDKSALVGNLEWCATHTAGIQPGWSANDATFTMPDVELPYAHSSKPGPLQNVWVTNAYSTNFYHYVLDNGDYWLNELKEKNVLITGSARLLIKNKLEFTEDNNKEQGIDFDPGAKLELYADCNDVKLKGKKDKKKGGSVKMYLNGEGNTTNFFFYGTEKCHKMEFKNLDDFTGIVYAPHAEVKISAGSIKYYHCNFHGAVLGKRVSLDKNCSFHYDENLVNLAADSYMVEYWGEL